MTVITIDEKLINEVIAVSHYDNAQEAVIKILRNYLHQQKKITLFERLRFVDEYADDEDDISLLFERDKDTGRDFEL
jgi:Arc/MetJ family transcription regulator